MYSASPAPSGFVRNGNIIKSLTPITEVELTNSGNPIITADGTSLTLQETGDTYGTVSLSLRNRVGTNGALFTNNGLDLVDFAFNPSSGTQQNVRYEHRTGFTQSANSAGEFQLGPASSPNFITGAGITLVNGPLFWQQNTGNLVSFFSLSSTTSYWELTRDVTPTRGLSIGHQLPGSSLTNNIHVGIFVGGVGWSDALVISNTNALNTGTLTIRNGMALIPWDANSGSQPAAWIDLPLTGPSGIGSGGAGSNAFIAYAFSSNQWYNNTGTGDIAIRGLQSHTLHIGVADGSNGGDVLVLNSTQIIAQAPIISNSGSLQLQDNNDTYGTINVYLRNRTGINGLLINNAGLDLADIGFLPNSGVQSNIRLEHRGGSLVNSNNTTGEFQYFMNSSGTPVQAMAIGGTDISISSAVKFSVGGTNPTDQLEVNGNLSLITAGNKIKIATGTNASAGTGTLSGGTATISTTAVTASSLIFVTDKGGGVLANIGSLYVGTVTAGTSFVVNSTNALDSSNFFWWLIN